MKKKTSTIIWIGLLATVSMICIFALWYLHTLKKILPDNCELIKKKHPSIKWNDDCTYIQEISADGSIKTPQEPLYLSSFTSSDALGPPLGANVWYRYRFVRGDTGGYGQFSPWTTHPIMAGSHKLPCKDNNCYGILTSGGTCRSNLVTVAVDKVEYSIDSGIYANVHRIVKDPHDTSQPTNNSRDEIVGYLWPDGGGNSFVFIDTTKSPCNNTVRCNRPGC